MEPLLNNALVFRVGTEESRSYGLIGGNLGKVRRDRIRLREGSLSVGSFEKKTCNRWDRRREFVGEIEGNIGNGCGRQDLPNARGKHETERKTWILKGELTVLNKGSRPSAAV